MHRLTFGLSFAELVALILLPGLAFYILNKKKTSARRNAEDVDTSASGSLTAPTETNSGGSSSSSTETNNGASSSLTVSTGNCYEVFLSFRGPDTRHGFTDHLYHGLLRAGIEAFRDDDELSQGENIRSVLMEAIKNSKILIPIFSVTYGTSSWCLDELVQIMERKKNNGQIVLPIFYKVKPAEVRHQTGSFGEAFHGCESRLRGRPSFNPNTLEKWKNALDEVSALKGFEAVGYEAKLVESIVRKVLSELKKKFELVISEHLVGIDSHVNKVMEFVVNKSDTTLFVGIHGMGGIGKTTLAKAIYNKVSDRFEHRSFIADIRESLKRNGLHYVQNKLIYDILKPKNEVHDENEGTNIISSMFKDKKVLIFLDDVESADQLHHLARNRNWFFPGSRIIIITRDKRVLKQVGVDYTYHHKEMDDVHSLILFSRHAFRRDSPSKEFKVLTHEVVSIAKGLPLSLEVFGSLLCGQNQAFWRGKIDKLNEVPPNKVRETLRISYEALDYQQRQIFLDIACFFIGSDSRMASYMWKACRFFPEEGIEVLRFMSLIKIGDDQELRMHDQLRDLGRTIVREGNEQQPWHHSRLWDPKESLEVLKRNKGTDKIEAIILSEGSSIMHHLRSDILSKGSSIMHHLRSDILSKGSSTMHHLRLGSRWPSKIAKRDGNIYTEKQFKNLTSLRFLDVEGAHLSGDFKDSIEGLIWLRWPDCNMNFKVSNLNVTELAILELSGSMINEKWEGWSSFMMAEKLKFLDLSFCQSLKNTDFLSAFKNLEVLILNNCHGLQQIDSSIGDMKALLRLELRGCTRLMELPAEIGKLKALEQLFLHQTPALSALPDSIGSLKNLEILDISLSGIEELPNGIERLRKLRNLDASNCKNLKGEMPESMCNLSSLQRLDFLGCYELQSLPDLPSSLTYLGVTCQSRQLPSLSHLKELRVSDCEFIECIPKLPSECSQLADVEESELQQSLNTPFNLETLEVYRCGSIETLDVSQFIYLRTLTAKICNNLHEVRGLDRLIYLESLTIAWCASIERLDLPKFKGLKKLDVHYSKNLAEIKGLDKLEFLESLNISCCTSIERLDLPTSGSLKKLDARQCENLAEVQGLDRLEFLEMLVINGCTSIKRLDLPTSERLKKLDAGQCENLVEIKGLNRLEFLESLYIYGCTSIERLDLPISGRLKKLDAEQCENLAEVKGLDRLEFLESLNIYWCTSIERLLLPKSLNAEYEKLAKIQCLNRLEFLETLGISGCTSIERLDLPKFRRLKELDVTNCENLAIIQGLGRLEFLETLHISGCVSIERLDLLKSVGMKILHAENCANLVEIHGLNILEFLKMLNISGCTSFERLPNLRCFDTLERLKINRCDKLHDIQSLERFPSCQHLWIEDCKSLTKLPNLSSFHNLDRLSLSDCHELREIPGLEESKSLTYIAISGCSSIEILPDLSSCTRLTYLIVQNCEKLTELRGLKKLEQLEALDISGCKSLKTIPELSGARLYQNYENKPLVPTFAAIEFRNYRHFARGRLG